jgi:hypothetical protein
MADRSAFSIQIEELLSGWALPIVGLAVLAVMGGLYLAGLASEEAAAAAVVLVVGWGVALYLLRPVLDPRRDAVGRGLAAAAAVATLAGTVVPALASVRPGQPLFAGDLAEVDQSLPVPEGVSGAVRVLVSGKLAQQGEPSIGYTLTGTQEPVEGKIERTFGYARVGRGGRTRVAHDRTADMSRGRLPAGARSLKLDRLQGQTDGPLHVAVFRDPIPVPGGPWLLALLAILLAIAAEARLGQKNDLAVWSGMAVAFGLLVSENATPAAAVGPAVGGIVLGAILGSLAGWILGLLLRRFVPAPEGRPAAREKAAAV